jgi:hypothetical protein
MVVTLGSATTLPPPMQHVRFSIFVALALTVIALVPIAARRGETRRMSSQLVGLTARHADEASVDRSAEVFPPATPDPALVMRVDEPGALVASWQTVGGCGAGSGGGSSIGLKWIGHNVRGGLFNVQEQLTYTKIGQPDYPEHNFFSNSLITRDIGEKLNVGVNLPFIYKYLVDPQHLGGPGVAPVDYSNSGLGDISLLCTLKLGRINAASLTGMVGLPTGVYDAKIGTTLLNQSQQIGFGRPTFGLTLDQTLDEVWGLWVVGGTASYRGGTNKVHNYRAPSATIYGYVGYFLGPLVPAAGVSMTGYTGHDRDQDTPMSTPLASVAANLSLEWSADWIAVLVAGSVPYGYNGNLLAEGTQVSKWGFLPWTVSLGIAVSPF